MDYQLDREVSALTLTTANNGVTVVCVLLCFALILFLRFASFVLSHLCLLEFFRYCFDVLREYLNRK